MSARAWTSFAAVSVLWGIPYLFIKVAVEDGVPPAFLAWARVLLAALVLCALAWQRGLFGSLRGRWRWVVFYAVVEIAIPFPLIAAGEQHVSSSLAAILIAAVPLIVALLAIRFDPDERVRGARLIGLLVGFARRDRPGGHRRCRPLGRAPRRDLHPDRGRGLRLWPDDAEPQDERHRARGHDGRLAGRGRGGADAVRAGRRARRDARPPRRWRSVVVLGLLCTAAAFVLFGGLLLEVGPGRAAVITYVAPVVAVGLGVAVLGERPGVGAAAGLLLILAGSWLSTDGRLPPGMGAWVERVRERRRGAPKPARAGPPAPGAEFRAPAHESRSHGLSRAARAQIRSHVSGAAAPAGRPAAAPGWRPAARSRLPAVRGCAFG